MMLRVLPRRRRALLSLLLLLVWLPAGADEINIAVAANFLGTLQQLAPKFEQASGRHLLLSAGSSGQLYAQIKQGAPFDIFFSADSERPRLLETQGLSVAGSRFTYAIGTLVLWSPRAAVVDAGGKILHSSDFKILAIANPDTAPYGAAAKQVLTAMGIWDQINRDHRIVQGQDINQAWQFAASGNADLAFIAKSQLNAVNADNKGASGSSWEPPQSQYDEIDQDCVILASSTRQPAAQAFIRWLRTDRQAVALVAAAGYRVKE
jgi:molybdate transport system substrate-binding protein